MQYDFYADYIIDDQNVDCGKIIQVGCDNIHRYVDPCELVAACVSYPALDRCSMIPGQVEGQPGIPSAQPGYLLSVNATGSCVERVAPPNNDTDVLVKVSDNDTTADYLQNKLVSCDPAKISINVQNEGGNEKLVLCTDAPDSFTDLTDTPNNLPSCEATVKVNNSGLFYICDRNYWGKMYLQNDYDQVQNTATIESYRMPLADYRGNPVMQDVTNAILIPETGMYEVQGKSNVRVDAGVQALRVFIATSNAKGVLADAKFGGDDNPARALIDTYKGKNNGYFEFSCQNIVKLNAGDIVWLDYKIDTNVENGGTSTCTFFKSVLAGNSTYNTGTSVKTPHGGTTLSVKRYCAETFNED